MKAVYEPMLGDAVEFEPRTPHYLRWTIDSLHRLQTGALQAKIVRGRYEEAYDPCVTRYARTGTDTLYVMMGDFARVRTRGARMGSLWRKK